MKIVIPTSAHDKHLLPALTDCLLKFGGLEEHQVLLFPTLSAKLDAYAMAEKLGAECHPIDHDFDEGAPVGCNMHFASVVLALGALGNNLPFLWMEADMLPTAPRWADTLQKEYQAQGKPFMGAVVDTPWNEDGELIFKSGDTMMMGCGVYPPSMERDERIKPLIADLYKSGMRNPRIPFDVYLRWAIKTIGVANTPLNADMWSTQNYRRDGEGIFCETVDHGDRVCRDRGGRVSPLALLVHGCKDGSLAKLLLAEAPAKGKANVAAPADKEDEGFWGDEVAPVPALAEAPAPAPKKSPKVVAIRRVDPAAPAPQLKEVTREDIHKALGGKNIRVKDLATKMALSLEVLIGSFRRNGYIVETSGWVKSTL